MVIVDHNCRVSICMPTFNGSRYLRIALESALSQTFTNIELLIVDDASTDDTLGIAEEFARQDSRVRIYRNTHRLGLAGNWNRCLQLATGEWIKFLFQDDYLTPTCVEKMLELSLKRGAILVACDRNLVFEPDVSEEFQQRFLKYIAEHSFTQRFPNYSKLISSNEFVRHLTQYPTDNCIGEPTAVMFHRSAIHRFGYFISDLVQLTDWEYWMRIAVNTGLCYLPDKLATFRLHGRAATMLNRADSEFRCVVLDQLILYHELVYNPFYAPLRSVAKHSIPRAKLKRTLFIQYRYAQSIVNKHTAQDENVKATSTSVVADWKRVLSKYPRLVYLPFTCLPMRIRENAPALFSTIIRKKTVLKPSECMQGNTTSLVTIIIPCYNYGHLISQTLDSIMAQSYRNWECIIVDDGSTDNTSDIIAHYQSLDQRFKGINQKNLGPSAARNTGIKNSRGAYVQFLDADDLLEKRKIEHHVRYLEDNPDVDLIYGSARYFRMGNPDERRYSNREKDEPWMPEVSGCGRDVLHALLLNNIMVVSAPLIRSEVIEDVGYFDTTITVNEDWHYWIRCAVRGKRFQFLEKEETLSLIRWHPDSLSQDEIKMREEAFRMRRKVNQILREREALILNTDQLVINLAHLGVLEFEKANFRKGIYYLLRAARNSLGLTTQLRWCFSATLAPLAPIDRLERILFMRPDQSLREIIRYRFSERR